MRYLFWLVFPCALFAQSAESDQKITQTLITEIQQLRLAIERSTLLGARTQLAISQFQMQETAMARLSQQLNEVRLQATGFNGNRMRLAEVVKDLEQQRGTPGFAAPKDHDMLEAKIKEMKLELDQANAMETNRAAREGEITVQLQAMQSQIADSRSRIAEMERALDAAIQQLLKQK